MSTSGSAIEAYFTAAEFAELSGYEKLRLRNMKQNYEMFVKVGFDVQPPEFMRNTTIIHRRVRDGKSKRWENELSSGRKKGHKRSASFKVPVKKKPKKEQIEISATISTAPLMHYFMSDAGFSVISNSGKMSDDHEFDGIDFEADLAADVKPVADAKKSQYFFKKSQGRNRYSLREATRKSYKDLKVLEDDVYVYGSDHICHTQCDKTFAQIGDLTKNERTHTGVKPYKCTQCDKTFTRKYTLTEHERTHTGIKPYKCTQCDKTFTRKYTLTEHERTHTGIKPYKCKQCDKTFTRKYTLTEHERTHTGIKPYKCTQCDKTFTRKYTLTEHERTHTGIKPYKCTQCDKTFTQRTHLSRHERTHTGIKPYKCKQCDKAFTQKSHLTGHERTHAGIKPYICAQCGKAFTYSNNLISHERTHTGIKPYKCTQCDKTFAQSCNLTKHERTHTGISR